jgi:hypothetical protein
MWVDVGGDKQDLVGILGGRPNFQRSIRWGRELGDQRSGKPGFRRGSTVAYIDVKHAAAIARDYVHSLFEGVEAIRLEEVELTENPEKWEVTLSFEYEAD